MGFKDRKIIRHEGFEPLALNEGNVTAIFNRCLASEEEKQSFGKYLELQILKPRLTEKESEIVFISAERAKKNKQSIHFLLGQIKNVHGKLPVISLNEGLVKYDDTSWTRDYNVLFQLYALGQSVGCFSDFSRLKQNPNLIAATKASDLTPTLSPKDPNFPAWWEAHKAEWESPAE